jgi:hypothetical protein
METTESVKDLGLGALAHTLEKAQTEAETEIAKRTEGKSSEEAEQIKTTVFNKHLRSNLREQIYPIVGGFQPNQKGYWADKVVQASINAGVLILGASVGAYVLRRKGATTEETTAASPEGTTTEATANPFNADVSASVRPHARSHKHVASI